MIGRRSQHSSFADEADDDYELSTAQTSHGASDIRLSGASPDPIGRYSQGSPQGSPLSKRPFVPRSGPPPEGLAAEGIARLRAGTLPATKYSRRGKPAATKFKLSEDWGTLEWAGDRFVGIKFATATGKAGSIPPPPPCPVYSASPPPPCHYLCYLCYLCYLYSLLPLSYLGYLYPLLPLLPILPILIFQTIPPHPILRRPFHRLFSHSNREAPHQPELGPLNATG